MNGRQLFGASSDHLQEFPVRYRADHSPGEDDRNITGIVLDLKKLVGDQPSTYAVHCKARRGSASGSNMVPSQIKSQPGQYYLASFANKYRYVQARVDLHGFATNGLLQIAAG